MATKPTSTPRWAETTGGVPATNITTPTSGEQDSGYTNGQAVVSSGKLNWLLQLIYSWILYLSDAVFTATAGSGLAGVSATGDGAAPGVSATPGGGASPARGALSLASQATPSAPANGDVWYDGTLSPARFSGMLGGIAANKLATPTLATGWATGGFDLSYWKDHGGMIHMMGEAQYTGATTTGVVTLTTLPAGFRPFNTRYFFGVSLNDNSVHVVSVSPTGVVQITNLVQNTDYDFSSIHFMAAQ